MGSFDCDPAPGNTTTWRLKSIFRIAHLDLNQEWSTNLQTFQIFPATCKVATQGHWEWRSPAALRKPGGSSSCHGCTTSEVISSKVDSHAAISKEPPLNDAGTNCPFWSSTLGYSFQENCQFFVLKSGCRLYTKTWNSYRHSHITSSYMKGERWIGTT